MVHEYDQTEVQLQRGDIHAGGLALHLLLGEKPKDVEKRYERMFGGIDGRGNWTYNLLSSLTSNNPQNYSFGLGNPSFDRRYHDAAFTTKTVVVAI